MFFQRLLKDTAVYGGTDLLTKAIYFFTFPIVAAVLSPKAFGALELIGTVTALLGLATNCGLNNSVQRYYWDKDVTAAVRPAIVTSGLYAQMIFGAAAVVAGLFAIPFVLPWMHVNAWPLSEVALVAALAVMALSQWTQYILDVIRLHLAPWRFVGLAMTSRVVGVGLGLVALVFLELGLDGLLGAQALVLILLMPLGLWMIRKDFRPASFDFSWLIKLVRFGHPFIYAGLAYWLLGSMDRWMLASMSSVEEVGIYSIAFRFASIVLFISTAFGQAWSPVAIRVRTDHPQQYRSIYGQVLLLLFFVMLVVGGTVALFSGEVISLIMPAEYLPSALPLTILCFGIVLQATQQVSAVGISLENKTHLFARIAWLTAAINFVGNWLLIPPLGAAGAAWATLISYVVLTFSFMYYTQRLHPLVVQWGRLVLMCGMGVLIAFVSVSNVAVRFDFFIFVLKFMIGIVCFFLGWRLLPIHAVKRT